MLRNRGGPEWAVFKRWMRDALLQREAQRWIIADWLTTIWLPSFDAVREAGGSTEEALVNARIWNSSKGSAMCTLRAASRAENASNARPVDRIQMQLNAYASGCPRSSQRYIKDRWPYMLRPVVLLKNLQ
jgi:hypothetical protein